MSELKAELAERLKKAMDDKVPIVSVNTVELAPTHVFGAGVLWKPLTPSAETLEEYNEGTRYRAPTVGEDEIQYVKKRNYGETIDWPPFIDCYDRELLNRFKTHYRELVSNFYANLKH